MTGWAPVRGPSRIGEPGGEEPLPLSAEELAAIAADYARSAAHVKAGGLDGVEIHGAHGWLVGQFLSPFYNRREDSYGGSVENRCRFALEVGAAMRAEVGPEFPLGIALTYDEMIGADGITDDDTLAQLEVFLAAGIFDFFDFSIGSPHASPLHDRADGGRGGLRARVRRPRPRAGRRAGSGLRRGPRSSTRGWRRPRSATAPSTWSRCRAPSSPTRTWPARRARGGRS